MGDQSMTPHPGALTCGGCGGYVGDPGAVARWNQNEAPLCRECAARLDRVNILHAEMERGRAEDGGIWPVTTEDGA